MEIFVEKGRSHRECVDKIVKNYGERYIITRHRKIPVGGFLGFFAREGVELEFYIPPVLANSPGRQTAPGTQPPAARPLPDWEEQKRKLLAAAGRDPSPLARSTDVSQGQILEELRAIKAKIDTAPGKKEEHPSLIRMAEILRLNDFSDTYIKLMLDKARSELALEIMDDFEAVQDRLLEWIGETIRIYNEPFVSPRTSMRPEGRIVALVGPTGVGKTTTIAKLAAIYGLGIDNSGRPPLSVRMITIDAFRIGARAQIEKYSEIMNIPVSYVDNRRELRKEIALYQEENDLILIDTFGKSPKDSARLGEMKDFLSVCGTRLETHLVLSASTKTSDITGILQQFEPFNYHSVILTKIDETGHVGNMISALADKGKPVSFITDGQNVPNDIKKAGVIRFLINLEEFTVNREKLEKRFPMDEAEKFLWS